MDTVTFDGVEYCSKPDPSNAFGCTPCAGNKDIEVCKRFVDQCLEKGIYWVRKDQAELNAFFGKPITSHIQNTCVEIPITQEEEEAWQEAQKKVATGVTDGPAERAAQYHRQVGGSHYFNPIQPWDIIRAWELNYWEGNIVKYVLRHKGKNKVEDLEKARHYLDYLIENYDELYPVSN